MPAPDKAIDEQLAEKENRKLFRKKLKEFRGTLQGREMDIFDNRIMREEPLRLRDLGEKYQISRERVRQIQVKIVEDIKGWMIEKIPDFEEAYFD